MRKFSWMMHCALLGTIVFFLLTSCEQHSGYRIGMSQCAGGEWREQMNNEVLREILLHDDIELDFTVSYDDDEKQIRDIDSLINIPVDVLIVSPTSPQKLKPAIERAYDAGIPVILVDRDVYTEKYAAFIGGDNKEVGRLAAQWVANRYKQASDGKTVIIEIEGDTAITPVQQRHYGFVTELEKHSLKSVPAIANWQKDSVISITKHMIVEPYRKDNSLRFIVFSHNDAMARDVLKIIEQETLTNVVQIIGVDGSPVLGMQLVIDGSIEASVKYATGGAEAIKTALSILENRSYERKQIIKPIIIDENNAITLRDQEMRAIALTSDILKLGDRLSELHRRSNWQSTSIITMSVMIFGLIITIILIIRKTRANRALQQEVMESIANPEVVPTPPAEGGTDYSVVEPSFISKLREIITQNYSNPGFSIDDMGDALCMGRTAFYRKTKEVTGCTPNDILRSTRLQHAAQLLIHSDLNVSDISHRCGFGNPSSFTRAFRDQYNMSPKEYREKNVVKN